MFYQHFSKVWQTLNNYIKKLHVRYKLNFISKYTKVNDELQSFFIYTFITIEIKIDLIHHLMNILGFYGLAWFSLIWFGI